MNRRKFLESGAGAAVTAALGAGRGLGQREKPAAGWMQPDAGGNTKLGNALDRYRFGVNYTPSHEWWFCWNNWDADPIKRDLDAIAGLGADHLSIMLIWPYF